MLIKDRLKSIPPIVITMTTWSKRIKSAETVITHLMNTLSGYDKFYLFLAKTEFSDLSELPASIRSFIDAGRIEPVFLEKNHYAFKRWFVYPKHYNDIVISLDDDVIYPDDIIEQAKRCYLKTPENCIYNLYNTMGGIVNSVDAGINIFYGNFSGFMRPYNTLLFFAQAVIMPRTFPLEIFDHIDEQLQISPHDDELWVSYFLFKNNVAIKTLNYDFFTIEKLKDDLQSTTWIKLARKCINLDVNVRSLQWYIILRYFNAVEDFMRKNVNYVTTKYDDIPFCELLDEYKNSMSRTIDFNSDVSDIMCFADWCSPQKIYEINKNNPYS